MALFSSDVKETVKRLVNKEFNSPEERDELLARLAAADGVRARDVVWTFFRPDRGLRDGGAKILARIKDPETLDVFLAESKAKPESAVRAAVATLFTLGIPGLEARLAQFLVPAAKETKDMREMREQAQRLVVEAPMTPSIAPMLWELQKFSNGDERISYINKLASVDPDERSIAKWQALAREEIPAVRDKALELLSTRAPMSSIPLFVEQLPRAPYAIQQMLVGALTRAAAGKGPDFAEQLLPLMASGDAATRTAVMKILMAIGQPAEIIKRYIRYAKSLAGFVRDRALESIRAFGDEMIEPIIELLGDPDEDVRAAAVGVAAVFDDPRILPATIPLLKDPDWWIRIAAADTLGRLKDARGVEPLIAALADPDVKWSAVEALGRIGDPRALNALGQLLADPLPDVRIEVLEALKHFKHPQVPQVIMKIATTDPNRNVRTRALDVLDDIAKRDQLSQTDVTAVRSTALAARAGEGEPKLHSLLIATRNGGGSDFHLSVDQPPIIRLSAELVRAQGEPFTAEQTEEMLREILTEPQWEILTTHHQLDFCYTIPQGGRYRGNVFHEQRGFNAVFRVIPEKPPTINEVGLPPQLSEIADYHQGLVIVCGPSGSGKSTTLAALVNLFNETRSDHILTMEDPVEFVHPFKNCLINQREVGAHTQSFARALRAALREDPDVIVIGELRDNETILLALTAAETGHIVLGTLNSTSAPKAIDRIIGSFPADEQPQVRASLSESMKYVIAQRLLPAKEARKQVACFEILKGTSNIGSMIRDEKTFQIYSAMQIGRSLGMQTFDEALKDLVRRDLITAETAYMAANKREEFEPLLSPEFLKQLKG
jgi:twitching motility protein PilT